jgi:hypothetical protein
LKNLRASKIEIYLNDGTNFDRGRILHSSNTAELERRAGPKYEFCIAVTNCKGLPTYFKTSQNFFLF